MLTFKKIDFDKDLHTCVAFREDSYRASFPGRKDWNKYWNPEDYANWIQLHAEKYPDGAVHIWFNSQIIGQLEFTYGGENAHVNLYYLVANQRGKGFGSKAHEHVVGTLKEYAATTATLRVSPLNEVAIKFYRSNGWQDLGADPNYETVNLYRLRL